MCIANKWSTRNVRKNQRRLLRGVLAALAAAANDARAGAASGYAGGEDGRPALGRALQRRRRVRVAGRGTQATLSRREVRELARIREHARRQREGGARSASAEAAGHGGGCRHVRDGVLRELH